MNMSIKDIPDDILKIVLFYSNKNVRLICKKFNELYPRTPRIRFRYMRKTKKIVEYPFFINWDDTLKKNDLDY